MSKYAIIDGATNVCVNIASDERTIEEIQYPGPDFLVCLDTTPCVLWQWNEDIADYVAVEEIGVGGIGCAWDGAKLVRPKPNKGN